MAKQVLSIIEEARAEVNGELRETAVAETKQALREKRQALKVVARINDKIARITADYENESSIEL